MNVCKLPEAQRNADVQRLIVEESQRTFDLIQGPLLRCTLLRVGEQEHILLFTIHHIVSDGWSIGLLVQELAALYEAFSTGKHPLLPELTIQYADFALWQREWLQGKILDTQLAYWKEQLANAKTVLELPTDRPRSHLQTSIGKKHSFSLPATLSNSLKSLSQQEGVTLFMTLLAAFNTLLYHYTNQEDILIGSAIANRNRSEIEQLIGFFINTLVLRTNLSNNPSFRYLLQRVKEVTLDAYTHQDLPFEKLVAELQLERNLNYTPLFQVWFVLQNAPMSNLELAGLKLSFLEAETVMVKHDLKLDISETPEGIKGFFEYKTDLFDASTIARMSELFVKLLTIIVEQPDIKLNQLRSILNEAEKQDQFLKHQNFQAARSQKLGKVKRKGINSAG
jgi:non-ribosomal peptide synthetase component F